ncbi:MAG TPA: PhoH family protein [Spirochaetota bacterium]|nr:PhoH family protein [Spirochaetota bacterium]
MKKNFVLDTNVLIHNPQALYSFTDNIVVVPITVIEELDRFKNYGDKKGMHARQALRNIDSHIKKGSLQKGAKMKNGGLLKIMLNREGEDIPSMNANINDNKILSAAYNLLKEDKPVFFISKDVNARIKAEALGIKTADYEKQKVEYNKLYRGWREIELKTEEITVFFKNKKMKIPGINFKNNEFARLKSGTSTALAAYDSVGDQLLMIEDAFPVSGIHPLNMEQRFAFSLLLNQNIKLVSLIGQAGSGKTLLAIAAGLQQVTAKKKYFKKMLIARPVIPMGKDIGFLPGSKDQKLNYWMQPIFDNLDFILNQNNNVINKDGEVFTANDSIDYLMKANLIEIEALTFIRGRSIPGQYLIVDEAQNLTPHEIKTIISRAGEGTKIVLTGDPEQIDNPYLDANSNGLSYITESLKGEKIYGHMFLSKSERSQLASLAAERL